MPGRMEMTESNAVDIGKRYDIYVAETPSRIVVYRGAFFRGIKFLEKARTYDFGSEFFEIEQANGDVVFLRRYTVIKFCDAGSKIMPEVVG
jgi:hypothetical protein